MTENGSGLTLGWSGTPQSTPRARLDQPDILNLKLWPQTTDDNHTTLFTVYWAQNSGWRQQTDRQSDGHSCRGLPSGWPNKAACRVEEPPVEQWLPPGHGWACSCSSSQSVPPSSTLPCPTGGSETIRTQGADKILGDPLWKSRIRETLNLSTEADSRTDTILEKLPLFLLLIFFKHFFCGEVAWLFSIYIFFHLNCF